MRRAAVFLAILSVFVFGFGFGVNAQSSRPSAAASRDVDDQTSRMNRVVLRELERIRELAPNVKLCTAKQLSDAIADRNIDRFGKCMSQLQKFALSTQKELDALDRFTNDFIQCTNFSQVTWRGLRDQTQGYVYDLGTGSTIKWTALDVADIAAGDGFSNFFVLRATERCFKFVT